MKKLLTTAFIALSANSSFAADVGPVMEPSNWFVHLGASSVMFDSGLASTNVPFPPGFEIIMSKNFTPSLEVGYNISKEFSVSAAFELPYTTSLSDNFGIAPPGQTITFGTVFLGGQIHPFDDATFDPYFGAGINYIYSTGNNVLPVGGVTIDSAIAPVLQVGVEVALTEKLGIFVDIKKEFSKTRMNSGPLWIEADRNALTVSSGVSFKF